MRVVKNMCFGRYWISSWTKWREDEEEKKICLMSQSSGEPRSKQSSSKELGLAVKNHCALQIVRYTVYTQVPLTNREMEITGAKRDNKRVTRRTNQKEGAH